MTNVLVVVADDMRFDHLDAMPATRDRIGGRGRAFTQARCNVALCQPARVGLLRGQLSREHGNLQIGYEGVGDFALDEQVAAWLADAGYRCGMFGKYVNGIDAFGISPPRGWSTWRQFAGSARTAEDFDVQDETGRRQVTGVHQSDWVLGEALEFMRTAPEPWFTYFAPSEAHSPFSFHPDVLHAFPHARCREVRDPGTGGIPGHVTDQPELTAAQWAEVQSQFRGRLRELATLDRAVAELLDLLDRLGQADRTVVLFTSDNGVYQGEHRRASAGAKSGPHDVALRVPLLAAGPGFPAGPPVDVATYPHQDLTATVVEVAGARPTLPAQAGTSLRAILVDPAALADRALLHEIGEGYPITGDIVTTGPRHPLGSWKLLRSPSVRAGGGPHAYELYRLDDDPDELHDLAGEAEHRATRDRLEALLEDLLAARR